MAYFWVSLIFTSCSHRIHRIGYTVKKSERWDCDLPVKKVVPSDTAYKMIGEIRFGECKYSKIKTEEDVILILKKDGCAIDADFVVIKEENKLSAEKGCYQCSAEFYTKKTKVEKSPDYLDPNNRQRFNHKQRVLLRIGLGLGIIATFLIWKVYLGF